MSTIPGIVDTARRSGDSARLAGTGIEVFTVFKTYLELDRQWELLREAFHWLSEAQLRAALAYAESHPDAMAERLAAESMVDERLNELWRRYPHTKPNHH